MSNDDSSGLIEAVASYTHDPLGFVLFAFPWGVAGTPLADRSGPEGWQCRVVEEIGKGVEASDDVIREAVASGHGVGKSALVAWILLWGLMTCDDARCAVTANTEPQLRTKTWPELLKWFRMAAGREAFVPTATTIHSADPEHKETWRIDMLTWSEHNREAFAGLHNVGKRIVVVFDEASARRQSLGGDRGRPDRRQHGNRVVHLWEFHPKYGPVQGVLRKPSPPLDVQHVDSRMVSFTN